MESWREGAIRRKLEQATDPRRPLRRGFFKGERPKGRKARLDELLQARKEFLRDLECYEEAKGAQAEFTKKYGARSRLLPFSPWPGVEWAKEWFEHSKKRYLTLLAQCERDGISGPTRG
jgi:hypothetical protein